MNTLKACWLTLLLGLLFIPLAAQNNTKVVNTKHTISGYIRDASSGEELIGASVLVKELGTGTVANLYGFYSLTLPPGTYHLVYSYVGFQPLTREVVLDDHRKIDVEMATNAETIQEVVITGEKENANVENVEMSVVKMNMETIEKIPALMGEVDVIKAIQLMPGVQTIGEGTSGFYVRGGGVDQNMILLDEAPVYNASHLLGFFSVFNSDAIREVQLFKGGIPSEYGGRLSSVLDIRMKNGNNKKYNLTGGIGTISSRLTVEGPLVKNKGSFLVAGRRTYADLFLKLSPNADIRENQLFFYDLSTKANYKINDRNRIFLSGYFGRDTFKAGSDFKISWGNATGTIRWNHLFSDKLFSNLTLLYSDFDYSLGTPEGTEAFEWESKIRDYSAKLDFNYFLSPAITLKYGINSTYHRFSPGVARGIGDETIFTEIGQDDYNALEHAIYISNEHKITARLSATYGIRYSMFQNIGSGTIYNFDDNFEKIDSTVYSRGDIFNTYHGPEPRVGLRYSLDEFSSLKASYNRTRQYVHLASNSTSSSPLDVWIPSTPNVKPQLADQVAVGYFRNFRQNMFEASAEVYYKDMQNVVDFKDHAQLLLNPRLEGELRTGRAWAYGLEMLVRKNKGDFTGWVSYTLSRARRKIDGINEGRAYFAKYDKTHDVSVVGSYQLNERWNFAANWVFSTGSAVTLPTGRFEYGGIIAPVYSDRNGSRLPSYHRLDLAVTLKSKPKENRRWNGEWVFSVYNAYFRKNVFAINFRQDEDNPTQTYAEKLYLFPIIPAVTYNFNF
ncbi:MAG: carboxypeptidase-like regulatory domain-containing protein [Salibacteraceae bacterium]